jgi:Phosphotransferase system mannitol/fructose-specific IIA domain (Ntr-type)
VGIKIVVIEECVDNWNEAIGKTAQALYKKGYVKSTFEQQCIEREKNFPTGLNTQLPIAIPHTEAEFVNESSICFLRLKKPVPFRSMEDPSEFVEVQYVLNLAISEGKEQVPMLAKVIETFQNVKFIEELAKQDIENFEKMLIQALE